MSSLSITHSAGDVRDTRYVIGCMSGTSLDGLDAALVKITGEGLSLQATFVQGASCELGLLGPRLKSLAAQRPMRSAEIAEIAVGFSDLHSSLIERLLAEAQQRCVLICIHGQTVFHEPPVSWQLLQPWPIRERFGIPIVFDLRQADLAAGGDGAPLTPLADWILFDSPTHPRTIVNLGGFCNVTHLGARLKSGFPALDEIRAFDVCACNQLLDSIARSRLGRDFDANGEAALTGSVHAPTLDRLTLALAAQRSSGRSLGTGDELATVVSESADVLGPDLARTACEAIARVIAAECTGQTLLAGGGVRNAALMHALRSRIPQLETTASLGVPIEFREAAAWAVLGALCQDRVPIGLPGVTGVRTPAPVAGTWIL